MGKLHRTNAGYLGVSMEETQDPFWTYNKLALPLSETQRGIQSVISSAGTPWSNLQNAFDGSISNYADGTGNNGTTSTITFPAPITGVTKLEYYYGGTSTYGYNGTGVASGPSSSSPGWVTVYNGSAITLSNLYFVSSPGDGVVRLYAVKINDAFYSLGGAGNPSVGDLGPSNYLVTHNGTTWQTSVSKFYGGATRFTRSSSQYLNIGTSNDYLFGTGDFCIETWFYGLTSTVSARQDIAGNYTDANTGWGLSLGDGALSPYFYYGNSLLVTAPANSWTINTWNHLAVVRNGSNLTIYINGSSVVSASNTTNISSTSYATLVGAVTSISSGAPQLYFDGYLQDFRIYKGIAKYTSSFTPPARSLVQTARRYPSGMHVLS